MYKTAVTFLALFVICIHISYINHMYTYGLCQTAVIIDYKVIPVLADVLVVILDLSAENFGL